VTRQGGNFALGASGGRRIFPAVMQLISFMVDHGMTLDQAFHTPRLDVSGASLVAADTRMPADARAALAARWKTTEVPYAVTPALYACPNAVHDLGVERHGCAFVMSPWGQVAAG
jgi:gamma-glutamyltranspeptidase / glutathione hydrolase